MKQTKTLVVLTCDAHDGDVEAEETVSFSVGTTSYEMELCADHLAQFHEAIGRWTALARPVVARRRRTPAKADRSTSSGGGVSSAGGVGGSDGADTTRGPDGSDRADASSNGSHFGGEDIEAIDWGAVRSWAVSHGYEVSTRGRVARDVLDAYLAAQHTEQD
ncbi:MAG: Lsr2 family protein [Actinomycetota bacterium]|jgi:hypothetical protein|nr:Lsr2 family protein [Actinomycetota bacterium]